MFGRKRREAESSPEEHEPPLSWDESPEGMRAYNKKFMKYLLVFPPDPDNYVYSPEERVTEEEIFAMGQPIQPGEPTLGEMSAAERDEFILENERIALEKERRYQLLLDTNPGHEPQD